MHLTGFEMLTTEELACDMAQVFVLQNLEGEAVLGRESIDMG